LLLILFIKINIKIKWFLLYVLNSIIKLSFVYVDKFNF
jgi:hypothetical protein